MRTVISQQGDSPDTRMHMRRTVRAGSKKKLQQTPSQYYSGVSGLCFQGPNKVNLLTFNLTERLIIMNLHKGEGRLTGSSQVLNLVWRSADLEEKDKSSLFNLCQTERSILLFLWFPFFLSLSPDCLSLLLY